LADKAKETAGSVAQSASHLASNVADQASHLSETVGGGMKSLAGTLREHTPGGSLGTAASSVAGSLERGGRFLEQEGLTGIGDELSTVIRRNPLPAMLVCVGIGFGLAHLLSPRR
jgi:hypothetical protein